jgi:uncharacterized membrane protein YhaH (DUF805 family)
MIDINPYKAPQSHLEPKTIEYGEINLFSYKGRLGRIRYIAYSISLIFLALFVLPVLTLLIMIGMATYILSLIEGIGPDFFFLFIYLVMLVPIALFFTLLTIQRVHDFNESGWFVLALLIPVVNTLILIAIWLTPGTQAPNNFGPKPPPNTLIGIIIAIVLLFLALLVLAGITIVQLN